MWCYHCEANGKSISSEYEDVEVLLHLIGIAIFKELTCKLNSSYFLHPRWRKLRKNCCVIAVNNRCTVIRPYDQRRSTAIEE